MLWETGAKIAIFTLTHKQIPLIVAPLHFEAVGSKD